MIFSGSFMQEFKLFIRNQMDQRKTFSPERQREFMKACENYIKDLKSSGKIIETQSLEREGKIISKNKGDWAESPFREGKEIIVGCYHIVVENLEEAIAI